MKKIIIVLLTVLTVACNSDNQQETENVEFTLISKASIFGDGEEGIDKQNIVITDSETWESLINQMDKVNNVSGFFTETNIDFTKFMIIAVFDEVKANGGYEVSLKITTDLESIIVNRVDKVSEGNATTVITQPYSIVKIAITDLPIVFKE